MDAAGGMRRERVLGGWWRPGLAWGRWLRGREVLAGIRDRERVTGHSWRAVRGTRSLGLGEGDLSLSSTLSTKCGVRFKCFSPARLLSGRDGVAGALTARAWEPGDLF